MSNSQPNPAFIQILAKILTVGEVVTILLSLAGVTFKVMHWTYADELLMLGLAGLSSVYFLRAFQMPNPGPNAKTATEKKGLLDLLALAVLPKLSGLSMSVALIGLLFGLLHLSGAAEMLMVGTSSLLGCLAIAFLAVATNAPKYPHIIGFLYRGIPIFIVTAYAFYNLATLKV